MENVKCPPSPLNAALVRHFAITHRIYGTNHGPRKGNNLQRRTGSAALTDYRALTDGILHEAAGTHRYAVAGLDPNEPLVVGLSFGAFMSVATPIPIPATVSG